MSDFLTVEQLAQQLQVSRTTIFSWIKQGGLREGVHYFRRGRVLRFRWQGDLFFPHCHPGPTKAEDAPDTPLIFASGSQGSQRGEAPVHNRPPCARRDPSHPVINLDY